MAASKRVVVLIPPDLYAGLKAEAGTVPMSEWVRNQVTGTKAGRVRALLAGCSDGEMEAVLGAIQEVLAEKSK